MVAAIRFEQRCRRGGAQCILAIVHYTAPTIYGCLTDFSV
jgi:hypothetical protein